MNSLFERRLVEQLCFIVVFVSGAINCFSQVIAVQAEATVFRRCELGRIRVRQLRPPKLPEIYAPFMKEMHNWFGTPAWVSP